MYTYTFLKDIILQEFFYSGEDKTLFLKRLISEFMKTKIPYLSPTDLIEEAVNLPSCIIFCTKKSNIIQENKRQR